MKKIILTGTHCSGKSTVLNWVNDKNIDGVMCMDEMIRHLAKIPNFCFTFDPNDRKSIEMYIFAEKFLSAFYKGVVEFGTITDTKLLVMDRCILDPLFYSTAFELEKTLATGVTLRQSLIDDINWVIKQGFFKGTTVLLMKPLPLDVEDKFRLKGEEIQLKVYETAKSIMNTFDIKYLEVSVAEAKVLIHYNLREFDINSENFCREFNKYVYKKL